MRTANSLALVHRIALIYVLEFFYPPPAQEYSGIFGGVPAWSCWPPFYMVFLLGFFDHHVAVGLNLWRKLGSLKLDHMNLPAPHFGVTLFSETLVA